MSHSSGVHTGLSPNVYRTVAASTNLTTVAGVPGRRAALLIFANDNEAAQTAVFKGADGAEVTATVPLASVYPPLHGDFAALGALGSDVTCVAGWIDDGTVPLNPSS